MKMQNYNQHSWTNTPPSRSTSTRQSNVPPSLVPLSSLDRTPLRAQEGGFDDTPTMSQRPESPSTAPRLNVAETVRSTPRTKVSNSPQQASHSRTNSTDTYNAIPNVTSYGARLGLATAGGRDNTSASGSGSDPSASSGSEPRVPESDRHRLNQLMQNFFTKMVLVVTRSRMDVPPVFLRGTATRKLNKWFNVELEETDIFRDDLRPWKNSDAVNPRPPSLIVETYLDAEELTPGQTLVILDESSKRYNVDAVLNASRSWRRGSSAVNAKKEVILERWRVDLSQPSGDLGPELAVVYKKSIVLFRSLYAYARLLPTWKFQKRLAKVKLNSNGLRICCRVVNGDRYPVSQPDPLEIPLVEHERDVTNSFQFGNVECPAGVFSIQVTYRKNCDFRVDENEALLSSHFLNLDESYFRPSLHQRTGSQPVTTTRPEPGSLPPGGVASPLRGDPSQAYGSLTSFHPAAGVTSQSPISALRNLHLGGGSSNGSPADPSSLPNRFTAESRSSLRSVEGQSLAHTVQRRPSVSFMQPFKSPSLSASPSADYMAPSPRTSLGRIPQVLSSSSQARQRNSLGTMSPSSFKSPAVVENIQTASSSQESVTTKPNLNRFSSSFGQRRPRLSSGASRTEDDNNSSGKGSFASSTAPGSGVIADAVTTAGVVDEDTSLADFMELIEDKKSLKSFQTSEESGKRTAKALSKFSKMKDANTALSDSLSSSLYLNQRAPVSTSIVSRQAVPPGLSGTSVSTSSSLGKPLSPHTPAIPSRLGLNETSSHDHRSRDAASSRTTVQVPSQLSERLHAANVARDVSTTSLAATTSPMNIPSSPHYGQFRRSSSLSQGHAQIEDSAEGFNSTRQYGPEHRHSTSLDSLEKPPPFALTEDMSAPTRSTVSSEGGIDAAYASASPSVPSNASPVDPRLASRGGSTERILGSSFGNRRPYKPSRGSAETSTRSPMARTPSDSRAGFPADDDLLFDFSDRDMVQRRSLEAERSASASKRGFRGASYGSDVKR